MLASVPAWKLDRWEIYEQLEPFATERIEKHLAAILARYHNQHVDKKDRIEPKELHLAVPTDLPPETTPEQRMAAEQANARAAAAADKARREGR